MSARSDGWSVSPTLVKPLASQPEPTGAGSVRAIGAAYYAGNLHKWVCAPKGAGFLYARPEHHARLDPPVLSWDFEGTGFGERHRYQGTRDPAAYLDPKIIPGLAGLGLPKRDIEQMYRLFSTQLYNGNQPKFDSEGRARVDDWEMRPDIQAPITTHRERRPAAGGTGPP